jgi:hypothetical protein
MELLAKNHVFQENVKSDIECMTFPIIPKAGCASLATSGSLTDFTGH